MSNTTFALLGFLPDVEARLKELIEEGIAVPIKWVSATDAALDGVVINANFLNSPQIQKYIQNVKARVVCCYRDVDGLQQSKLHSVPGLHLDGYTRSSDDLFRQWLDCLSGRTEVRQTADTAFDEKAYLSRQMQEIADFAAEEIGEKENKENKETVETRETAKVTETVRQSERQQPETQQPETQQFQAVSSADASPGSVVFGQRPQPAQAQPEHSQFAQPQPAQLQSEHSQPAQTEPTSDRAEKVADKTVTTKPETAAPAPQETYQHNTQQVREQQQDKQDKQQAVRQQQTAAVVTRPAATQPAAASTAPASQVVAESAVPAATQPAAEPEQASASNANSLSDDSRGFLNKLKEPAIYLYAESDDKKSWIDTKRQQVYIDYPRDSIPGIDTMQWSECETLNLAALGFVRRVQMDLWLFETIWQSSLDGSGRITSNNYYKLSRWPRPLSAEGRSEALRMAAFAQTIPVNVKELQEKTQYAEADVRRFIFATLCAGQMRVATEAELPKTDASQSKRKPDKEKLGLLGRIRNKLGLG